MPSNEVVATEPATVVEEPEAAKEPVPEQLAPVLTMVPPQPASARRHLGDERPAMTRKFEIPFTNDNGVVETFEMYVTVGVYPDGSPGEVFIKTGKSGEVLRGALDALGTMMSLGLQYGVPMELMVSKLIRMNCGPSGFIRDPEFKSCSSPFDLMAQWLNKKYCPKPADDANVQEPGHAR